MRCPRLCLPVLLCLLACHISGCVAAVAGAAAGGAAGTAVSVKEGREEHHNPMTYVGTVLANVVYLPAKIVFAGAGAVTSGAAYLLTLGDAEVSRSIWNPTVNGDYVVTPDMIDGERAVHFVGS